MEHRYLLTVLRGFGYPSELVDRLQELYKGVSAAVVVNGRLCPSFAVGRGIRQGCPLSPLLFVLAIDPLLRRVHCSTDIRGFPLPGQEQVKVSAYADYATFQAYGFPPAFAEVVRALHKGITSDSTINGQIQGKIKVKRGVRQDSPSSPFFLG